MPLKSSRIRTYSINPKNVKDPVITRRVISEVGFLYMTILFSLELFVLDFAILV